MKGISRIDQPTKRNHGWYARVRYGTEKRAQWFADSRYGSPARALRAARAWVIETHIELGKPLTSRRVVSVALSSTGIVGVSEDQKSGGFLVTWSPKVGEPERVYVPARDGLEAAKEVRKTLERKMYASARLVD